MDENMLWPMIVAHAGETFHTTGRGRTHGKSFTCSIRGGEMFISTKSKSITKATVMIAYRNAVKIQNTEGFVSSPKRLGTFGASYLYPIFWKLNIISRIPPVLLTVVADDIIMESQDNAKECANMPRPKGSKNKKTTVVIEVDTTNTWGRFSVFTEHAGTVLCVHRSASPSVISVEHAGMVFMCR